MLPCQVPINCASLPWVTLFSDLKPISVNLWCYWGRRKKQFKMPPCKVGSFINRHYSLYRVSHEKYYIVQLSLAINLWIMFRSGSLNRWRTNAYRDISIIWRFVSFSMSRSQKKWYCSVLFVLFSVNGVLHDRIYNSRMRLISYSTSVLTRQDQFCWGMSTQDWW